MNADTHSLYSTRVLPRKPPSEYSRCTSVYSPTGTISTVPPCSGKLALAPCFRSALLEGMATVGKFIQLQDSQNVTINVDPKEIALVKPLLDGRAAIILKNGVRMAVKQKRGRGSPTDCEPPRLSQS